VLIGLTRFRNITALTIALMLLLTLGFAPPASGTETEVQQLQTQIKNLKKEVAEAGEA